MKRLIFVFATALMLLCNINVKAQIIFTEEWAQESLLETVEWLHERLKDFDRECFLIGALDDTHGHYQTFTANKSSDEINDKVKWLFRKDLKFIPDTMRCQRITVYEWRDEIFAMFVIALFKDDYPDLRALRVCSVYPFLRYYGSEVKATGPKEPVCDNTTELEIELLSSSLAKTVAGYYNFDYDNVSAVSSGGDIGYPGVIKKEKIATDAQKMSFLAGVFLRYGRGKTKDDRDSVHIPNSLSTAKVCVDILKEFGCDNVDIEGEEIVYKASDKIRDLISLIDDLYMRTTILVVS
jgi:hypothetical protein